MWLFLPGGLLMPSIVPAGKGDPAYTNNGLWMMQVRGRVKSHLENFIRDYMEDGTYSEIEATPQMDYNFRFYTTHEALAFAVAKSVLDIDYAKFKPTAERVDAEKVPLYKDGKEYHNTLNSIWSTVTKLGSPGGSWGAYSSTNPNGYKNARDYYSVYERPRSNRGGGNSRKWWEEDYDFDHSTGKSFFDGEGVDMESWEEEQEKLDKLVIAETLIELMVQTDLDVGQWFPFITHTEDEALREYANKSLNVNKADLEPVEQDLMAHYFGENWESKLTETKVLAGESEPPFENMDSNVQFERVSQKPSQRRKNRRRNGKRNNKVARGQNFN